MMASIAPRIALNRVNTLARTIWTVVRVGAAGTSLTCPRATRSATSAVERPRAGSTCDDWVAVVAVMSAERNGLPLRHARIPHRARRRRGDLGGRGRRPVDLRQE